ncbi:MAG TPA: glycosyltransferase [Micromonosporaceae bacterium]
MSPTFESRRPRILYLAFYFPPSRASGVYRARATANYLCDCGWDVTTFASPLRFLYEAVGSVDEELLKTIDPRIRIERPTLDMFDWEHDLRQFSGFRGMFPLLARKIHVWQQTINFPEKYASWGWASVRHALRLHARRRFDVVLATGNPFASFAAAWLFHRLTKVPYFLDYRDSWTLNLFTDSPAFSMDSPVWKWERRVLSNASGVVFVNNALREWHAARYPRVADKMMVVPNGWDPDLLQIESAVPDEDAARRPLRFGYLGTLTQNQPVEEMAEAFHRARRHPELAEAELDIYGHLGFFRNSPPALLKRLGIGSGEADQPQPTSESGIFVRGPVPKTEVATVYRNLDVLVFLAGGGRYVTSGKIFEYMASGRPIVSVHSPDIAAREVLEGYPLWFSANSLDPDDIAQSMVAAGKAARDLSIEQIVKARQFADRYTRKILLAPLEERLRAVVR